MVWRQRFFIRSVDAVGRRATDGTFAAETVFASANSHNYCGRKEWREKVRVSPLSRSSLENNPIVFITKREPMCTAGVTAKNGLRTHLFTRGRSEVILSVLDCDIRSVSGRQKEIHYSCISRQCLVPTIVVRPSSLAFWLQRFSMAFEIGFILLHLVETGLWCAHMHELKRTLHPHVDDWVDTMRLHSPYLSHNCVESCDVSERPGSPWSVNDRVRQPHAPSNV